MTTTISGSSPSVTFSDGTTQTTAFNSSSAVTSLSAGTGVSVSGSTGSVTVSIPQAITTTSSVQFGSLGVGTAASGTTGEIRATNNVTAYYSSDARFKENIRPIPDATKIVQAIGGHLFDWTNEYIAMHGGEDGYFIKKDDFGVIAQQVQAVFPQAVRTRPNGTLAVDYQKLSVLAFASICELTKRIESLEGKE